MTDFSKILLKIDDLKAKIEQNSISPLYLGSMLEELVALLRQLDISDAVEASLSRLDGLISALRSALDKETSERKTGIKALGERINQNSLSISSAFSNIETIKTSLAELSAAISAARETRSFDGFAALANSSAILSESTSSPDAILYAPAVKGFVARVGAKYVSTWVGAEDFARELHGRSWTPLSGVIYIDASSGRLYLWSGADLRPVDNEADIKADRALECLAGLRLEVVSEERWEHLAESGEADDSVLYLMPEEDD